MYLKSNKIYPKQYSECQKVYPKILFHEVFILMQPGNQAVFTPLQAGLNYNPKNTIHSHFMTVTNTNPWQMITQYNI